MKKMIRPIGFVVLIVTSISCGDVLRQSRASSYLVIDSLAGIRGNTSVGTPATVLTSDVITNITSPAPCTPAAPCPTIFSDPGQAIMHIALKDLGTAATPTTATQVNAITLNRYHVEYVRADGRNTPGVDVPYPFDGALTVTVATNSSTFGFELVRIIAKEEAPLIQLVRSNQFITAFARVTFYGRDQAGNDTSATGSIQVDFGNFGDF
jgi:hypothetical protein